MQSVMLELVPCGVLMVSSHVGDISFIPAHIMPLHTIIIADICKFTSFSPYFLIAGLCLDQPGGTCLPKRQPKVISHQVVLYNINGTQVSVTHVWTDLLSLFICRLVARWSWSITALLVAVFVSLQLQIADQCKYLMP